MSEWKSGVVSLASEQLKDKIKGKKIALMMNTSALDNSARLLMDVIVEEKWANVSFFFGMEHGVRGNFYAGGGDNTMVDEKTGIEIVNLYQFPDLCPTAEWVEKVEAVVFCAQDVGVRHWTFTPWMLKLIDVASKVGRAVIILDRPNPIRGDVIEGGFAEKEYLPDKDLLLGFGYPLRHGMTIGEIALMYCATQNLPVELTVLKMDGWKRNMWYEETGLPWLPPSPNIPTVNSALYFAATGLMQAGNFSFGIKSTTPFQYIGDISWDGEKLAKELNSRNLDGVYFVQKYYQAMCTRDATHNGGNGQISMCNGVIIVVQDRNLWKPVETQIHMMDALIKLFPDQVVFNYKNRGYSRMGTKRINEAAARGESILPILDQWKDDAEKFREERKEFLLYP